MDRGKGIIKNLIIFALIISSFKLNDKVGRLEIKLVECMKIQELVTATIYYAVPAQTDNTPHITADGTRLHKRYVDKYRFLAVSRDLLKSNGGFLEYGDYVIVENTNGRYNGIWQVKDTMNKRFSKRIDFLVDKKTPHNKFENVTLTKIHL